jgi:hypothetical protein
MAWNEVRLGGGCLWLSDAYGDWEGSVRQLDPRLLAVADKKAQDVVSQRSDHEPMLLQRGTVKTLVAVPFVNERHLS